MLNVLEKETNALQIFNNPEFGDMELIEINNRPYFSASNSAKALKYRNPHDAILRHCRGVVKHEVLTNGGIQNINLITEGDLYRLITHSKLPTAEKFESWVFDEVLPSIRKHGGYLTSDKIRELVANPDLVIEFATALKNERIKNQQLQVDNKIKDTVIAELKPKADYMDKILQSKGTVPVTAIAKDYGMSATTFNKLLHDLGIQYNLSGTWFLYAEYQDCGYTHSKTFDYIDSKGQEQTRLNTQWTQKGRLFLYNLLKKNGNLPKIEQV